MANLAVASLWAMGVVAVRVVLPWLLLVSAVADYYHYKLLVSESVQLSTHSSLNPRALSVSLGGPAVSSAGRGGFGFLESQGRVLSSGPGVQAPPSLPNDSSVVSA